MSGEWDVLRAAAEAATPGPWEAYDLPPVPEGHWQMVGVGVVGDEMGHRTETMFWHDAAYIAAASPDVVLELLDRLAEVEGQLERTEQQIHEPGGFIDQVVDLTERIDAVRAVTREWEHVPPAATCGCARCDLIGDLIHALDGPQDAATGEVALGSTADACGPHRGAEGPNEDIGWCYACNEPDYTMRPDNEQFGLHADECGLPRRHEGRCVGGGDGHAPTQIVRGYWPGMDADVTAARVRFGASGAESDHGGRGDGEGLG